MEKFKLKSIIGVMVIIMACLGLSSCDDDDYAYYNSPIVGRWELVTVNGLPVTNEYDVDEFQFNYDGTGYFGYYEGRHWEESPIGWDLVNEWGKSILYVYYYSSQWIYEVSMAEQDGFAYLYLSDTYNGDLLVYRKTGNSNYY